MPYDDLLSEDSYTTLYDEGRAWREQITQAGGLLGGLVPTLYDDGQAWREELSQGAALGTLDVGLPRPNDLQGQGLVGEPQGAIRFAEQSATTNRRFAPQRLLSQQGIDPRARQPETQQAFGPGGGVGPGLREPWGDAPVPTSRSITFRITGFEPAWGSPPATIDGGALTWNPQRFIYELTNPAGSGASGGGGRISAHLRELASRGIYVQAYQDDALEPGLWRYRYVHVRTPWPEMDTPYGLGQDVTPESVPRAVSAESAAATLRRAQERHEESIAGRFERGEISDDVMFRAPMQSLYGPPKRNFQMQDYAWIAQRDLPFECPYPYPFMPVPQADYASGFWLEPDYVPSIPLPPPYDEIPWQCGVRATDSEYKGKPTPQNLMDSDFMERRLQLFEMSAEELKAEVARLEEEYGHLFDKYGSLKVPYDSLSPAEQLDVDGLIGAREQVAYREQQVMKLEQLVQVANGQLPGPPPEQPPESLEPGTPDGADVPGDEDVQPGPGELETVESVKLQMEKLAKEHSALKARLEDPSLSSGEKAKIKKKLEENVKEGRALASKKDDAERARKKASGSSRYGFGADDGALPNAGGVIADDEPKKKGANGGVKKGDARARFTRAQGGLRIVCAKPLAASDADASKIRADLKRNKSRPKPRKAKKPTTDCSVALQEYQDAVNKGLAEAGWGDELMLYIQPNGYAVLMEKAKDEKEWSIATVDGKVDPMKKFISYINEPPEAPDVKYLEERAKHEKARANDKNLPAEERKQAKRAAQVFADQARDLAEFGSKSEDPRMKPTTITLTNMNYSYPNPNTGKPGEKPIARITSTPAQDGADGNVKVNVDSLQEWPEQWKRASAGEKLSDPHNEAVSLFHEVTEHVNGALERKKEVDAHYKVGNSERDASTGRRTPGTSKALQGAELARLSAGDIETLANNAAAELVNTFREDSDLPVFVREDEHFTKLKNPDGRSERMPDSEHPSRHVATYDFADGTRRTMSTEYNAQGVPILIQLKKIQKSEKIKK